MVRLQPDLLRILDQFASETGHTRPEAMRGAFLQWAESSGFAPLHPKLRERPFMIFMTSPMQEAALHATGADDVDDAVNTIVAEWLRSKGCMPK